MRGSVALWLLGLGLWSMGAGPAAAHTADKNMRRTFVVERVDEGLLLYVRGPGPFVFGDAIAEMLASGKQIDSPFVRLERSIQRIGYRLQRKAIDADPAAFRARLARAYVVRQHGRDLALEVRQFRVFRHADDTPFGSPADARASLERVPKRVNPWLKESMIEVVYELRPLTPDGALTLASKMPVFEMGTGYSLQNQIIDARFEGSPPSIADGHLTESVRLDGSRLSAFWSFVRQGVLHILEGLDHVLFVLCLALGVTHPRRLFWMVTGFSIGHSATLIAGFLGYTPTAPWFVPAVEALIAASIIYAAGAAHRGDGASAKATGLFGLLHGFGFSFVLEEILGRDAEGLISSLLAFNLGVELGQLLIIAATLAVLWISNRLAPGITPRLRTITLTGCGLMAAYWVVERTMGLL